MRICRYKQLDWRCCEGVPGQYRRGGVVGLVRDPVNG